MVDNGCPKVNYEKIVNRGVQGATQEGPEPILEFQTTNVLIFPKIEKVMNTLKPTIKFYLSKNVHLKRIPDFKFIFDETVIKGQKINKLLNIFK